MHHDLPCDPNLVSSAFYTILSKLQFTCVLIGYSWNNFAMVEKGGMEVQDVLDNIVQCGMSEVAA